MSDFVPESEIDYDEVYRRGGRNCGDEDFAVFRCPFCDHVYMMEYEVDTVYLDGRDLTKRLAVFNSSFDCLSSSELEGKFKVPFSIVSRIYSEVKQNK